MRYQKESLGLFHLMPSRVTATTSSISLKYLTTVLKYQRESLSFLYGAIAGPAATAPSSFKHLVNLSWGIHGSQLFFYSGIILCLYGAIASQAATAPSSYTHSIIFNLSWVFTGVVFFIAISPVRQQLLPFLLNTLTIVNLSRGLIESLFDSVRIYRSLFTWIVSFDIFKRDSLRVHLSVFVSTGLVSSG